MKHLLRAMEYLAPILCLASLAGIYWLVFTQDLFCLECRLIAAAGH